MLGNWAAPFGIVLVLDRLSAIAAARGWGPARVVMAISSLCVDVCRWFPSRTHRDPHKLGEIYAQVAARLVR